jgi:hypothetical protein
MQSIDPATGAFYSFPRLVKLARADSTMMGRPIASISAAIYLEIVERILLSLDVNDAEAVIRILIEDSINLVSGIFSIPEEAQECEGKYWNGKGILARMLDSICVAIILDFEVLPREPPPTRDRELCAISVLEVLFHSTVRRYSKYRWNCPSDGYAVALSSMTAIWHARR